MTHSTHQSRHAQSSNTVAFLRGVNDRTRVILADAAIPLTAETIAGAIGNTPIFKLRALARELPPGVEVYAKGEHLNPGGSVKDRAALAMILDGIRTGRLTREKILIDATSGNTGIAYSMIASSLGFRTRLFLPANAGVERKHTLLAYGAEVIETDPAEGTDGAQREAKRLALERPFEYFYPDQYNNQANWRAHYVGTAEEIWKQTGGRVTHFVAALGTTGTFVGTVRRLKELNPRLRAIALQPDSPLHGIEGVKHLSTATVPGIWDASLADEIKEVTTEEAQEMCLRLAREEGLFVGVSSGANISAALQLAPTLSSGSTVATILCDTGTRYVNERLWKEAR